MLMAVKTVFVQREASPELREFLMSLHKRATEVVSFGDQVHVGDDRSIMDFLDAHRDDSMVYIDDPHHASVALLGQYEYGTIVTDEFGTLHVHHIKDGKIHRLAGMSRPENMVSPNAMTISSIH